jgi:hypothetical protein
LGNILVKLYLKNRLDFTNLGGSLIAMATLVSFWINLVREVSTPFHIEYRISLMDFRKGGQRMQTNGMAKRQLQRPETEIAQFRQAEGQTHDAPELKRLQALQLYGTRVRLASLMDVVGAGESPIRYRAHGVDGLRSK